MNLKQAVQKAAIDNGIEGVMEMTEHCMLSYQRTRRVWEGETSAKISDVIIVLSSLGLKLKIVKEDEKG